MPLKIVFEDESILVVDKDAGILVHPTHFERDGTLLNGLTHHLNQTRQNEVRFVRPHLVHRLDRETSGLLLVAKSSEASRSLCRQIKRKEFKKRYLAMVEGLVEQGEGEIDAAIGRDPELRRHLVTPDGKPSVSHYRVIEQYTNSTLLELEPVTGRTNQLRIHCAHIGHPILGDEMFGNNSSTRLCLHACGIEFLHPDGGAPIVLESTEPGFLK
ncbi:MAG: RluA family pseudouridine synthase, partial [Acidobacteriota bacterium]|nr:RluA family pseudouridine synthase [Acidobacteriota bacterium]